MKKIKTFFCVFFLMLINAYGVYASNPPANMPQPDASASTAADDPPPEEPPSGPIDENILVLTMSALILGSAVIYKNKIKKASV